MNGAVAFSLLLILSTVTVPAQNSGPDQAKPQTQSHTQSQIQSMVLQAIQANSAHCPLNLRAQQRMSGQTLQVNPGRQKGIAQLVYLTLTNPKLVGITAASITVHGFSPKGRVVAAEATPSDSPDATKTFNLILGVGPKQDVSTDLRLENFSAITRIDLGSVTYADGSTWSSTADQSCHIAPDALMLITSR